MDWFRGTLRWLPSPPPQKTALVTGANRGIGHEVVRQLATLGFRVYLGSRDAEQGQKAVDELKVKGLDVHLLVLDVTSDESVNQAFAKVSSEVEALDVLVNNAGIPGPGYKVGSGYIPILEETVDGIKATYEVNLFGLIRITQAFVPLIKKSTEGRIVNVGSGVGSLAQVSDKNFVFYQFNSLAYFTSKTALNAATVSYAKALEEFNIKVNAACPGFTATAPTGFQGHSVEIGAEIITKLATLDKDAPSGSYQNKDGTIPW